MGSIKKKYLAMISLSSRYFLLTCLFLIFFSVLGFGTKALASTYYVATTGNNANSGTSASPFRTIQKAADTASSGDTVIVRDGIYYGMVTISTTGRSGAPIIFQSENQYGAIIDGSSSAANGVIFTNAVQYITLSGFSIRNFQEQGIACYGNASSYITIQGNKIYDIGRYVTTIDQGLDGIYISPLTRHWTVTKNYFYNIGRTGPDSYYLNKDHCFYVGSGAGDTYHIFSYNICLTSSGPQVSSGGNHESYLNNIFAWRTVNSAGGAGFLAMDAGVTYATIANNQFYEPYAGSGNPYSISAYTPLTGWVVKNNMVWGGRMWYSTESGKQAVMAGNNYCQTDCEKGEVDPLFVSATRANIPNVDFRLQSNSPAINAGTNVGLSTDYLGNAISGLPDIGAYEYQSTIIPITYTLTINKTGTGAGTVTGSGTYNSGSIIQATATANSGSTFSGWSGNGCGTTGIIIMDANKTCAASFTLNATPTYTLTINKTGTGSGSVTGAGTYNSGTVVTAAATTNPGSTFSSWSGDCSSNGVVAMSANKTCTANFSLNTYTLKYTAGSHGSLTGNTNQTVNYGANGTAVIAVPSAGYYFVNWSDGIATVSRTDNSVIANKSVTANFAQTVVTTYTLTINKTGTGAGTVTGAGTYNSGTVVTATATTNTGSTFAGWSGDCNSNGAVTISANKNCTANFSLNTYTLTINKTGSGSGTVTGAGSYSSGSIVQATANANSGSTFSGWSGNGCGTTGIIIMDANRTCTASFTLNATPTYTLTINKTGTGSGSVTGAGTYNSGTVVTATATANAGSTFSSWSGNCSSNGSVTISANKTCTANFSLNTYTLKYTAGSHGSLMGNTNQTVNYGANGTAVTAVPSTGYYFVNWSDGIATASRTDNSVIANKSVTANFAQTVTTTYTLTINKTGTGAGTVTGAGTYNSGTVITSTATANAGSTFSSWSGDCNSNGVVTVNSNKTCAASFTLNATPTYALTINRTGTGSGSVIGAGTYNSGSIIQATATANSGSTFSGWSGNGCGTTGIIIMDANKTCAASFTLNATPTYTLTINKTGTGAGTVTGAGTYNSGTVITSTATANAGSTFSSWSGDCSSNGVVAMSANKTCTASFTLNATPTYTLTINKTGTGAGTVTGAGLYNSGTVITSTATANTGSTFSSWSGDCNSNGSVTMNANKTCTANFSLNTYTLKYTAGSHGSLTGNTNQTVNYGSNGTAVTAVPSTGYHFVNWSDWIATASRTDNSVIANKSVTANFAQTVAATYTLTINKTGTGAGTVTGAGTYNSGTVITSTATANTGSTFSSWSGNCSSNGSVTISANKTCTANFSLNTYTLKYTAGSHGSLTGNTNQTVNYGSNGTAVTAVPSTGYHFVNWSDWIATASRTDNSVIANKSVTANFAHTVAATYTLTINRTGTGTGPVTGAGTYNSGTVVTATATANTSSTFTGWSGDCNSNGVVTVNSNKTCTAMFTAITSNTYVISISAFNGTVTKSPDKQIYNKSDLVTLTAVADSGYKFTSWGDDVSGKSPSTIVTINDNKNISASFSVVTTTNNGKPVVYTSSPQSSSQIAKVVATEKGLSTKTDLNLTKRLAGRILLQVEQRGQAWYLDAVSAKRYYLADGTSAYSALRQFGLGIKNSDLNKIPVGIESRFTMTETDSDNDGLPDKLEEALGTNPNNVDSDGDGYPDGYELKNNYSPLGKNKLVYSEFLIKNLSGRIVIQTESRGEAWYINPTDGKRYYLASGEAAYQIMRYLSLGTSDQDIRKIMVGSLK